MKKFDTVIIGSGPAGLMAAIQAKRQGLNIAIFEKNKIGGQLLSANLIENFPAITKAIRGSELARILIEQAKINDIAITNEKVLHISKKTSMFYVHTQHRTCESFSIIVASGLAPRQIELPRGGDALIGKYIFYYAIPDDIQCRNKSIIILGSGDAAFDQALNFRRFTNDITIAIRGKTPKCMPMLLKRSKSAGIKLLFEYDIKSIAEITDGIEATFNDDKKIKANIIDICIGKEQNFNFMAKNLLSRNTKGIFWAGDCKRGMNRQASIACGDGTAAAMDAARYIKRIKDISL